MYEVYISQNSVNENILYFLPWFLQCICYLYNVPLYGKHGTEEMVYKMQPGF